MEPQPSPFILGLAKAELHLHLEGSVDPSALLELRKRHGKHSTLAEVEQLYRYHDFSGFLCSGFLTLYASLARKRHAMSSKLLCTTAIATWWALESAVTSRRRRRSSFVTHTLTRRIMDCGLLLMPGKVPAQNQFGAH